MADDVNDKQGNDVKENKKKETEKVDEKLKSLFITYTKKIVTPTLIVCLIDLQISYILAFLGKEQIAESLSSTIAEVIIGVMLGYFMKALFETFFEKREERLNKEMDLRRDSNADSVPCDSLDDCGGTDKLNSGRNKEDFE